MFGQVADGLAEEAGNREEGQLARGVLVRRCGGVWGSRGDSADGETALIDASADHAAVANGASTSTSAQIDITAAAVGVSWSISAKVLPSTLTLSTSTVQAAEY